LYPPLILLVIALTVSSLRPPSSAILLRPLSSQNAAEIYIAI